MSEFSPVDPEHNARNDELLRILGSGVTLSEAISATRREGLLPDDVHTLRQFVGYSTRIWAEAKEPQLKQMLAQPTTIPETITDQPIRIQFSDRSVDVNGIYELPGLKVEAKSAPIFIHGIIHQSGFEDTIPPLTQLVIGYAAHTSVSEKATWVTESELDRQFLLHGYCLPLEDKEIWRELQSMQIQVSTRVNTTYFETKNGRFSTMVSDLHLLQQVLQSRFIFTPSNRRLDGITGEILTAVQKDPFALVLSRSVWKTAELPQPLDLEMQLVRLGNPRQQYTNPHFMVDRSFIQARRIERIIEEQKDISNGPVNCHALVGLGHESQLSYFLLHPEYDPRDSVREAFHMFKVHKSSR